MRKRMLATVVLFLACAAVAQPQTVDFEKSRVQMADLDGPWRFHAGDQPNGRSRNLTTRAGRC